MCLIFYDGEDGESDQKNKMRDIARRTWNPPGCSQSYERYDDMVAISQRGRNRFTTRGLPAIMVLAMTHVYLH